MCRLKSFLSALVLMFYLDTHFGTEQYCQINQAEPNYNTIKRKDSTQMYRYTVI